MGVVVVGEAMRPPKGSGNPHPARVEPVGGGVCQVVQFFRKSCGLDFSVISLRSPPPPILAPSPFKHRAGGRKRVSVHASCETWLGAGI